ncbi:hypothetical protein Pcinc_032902 [Petrolisthes cinctipes]|uniref:Uncharacterized protein n=1 Tax=Petrolisthes cinctipes TaxID=88211 RepID=A0AAE1ETE4_PETCI|nr:hypothetical protein Pcinc_032902 [Petrolisthes cinctipes]
MHSLHPFHPNLASAFLSPAGIGNLISRRSPSNNLGEVVTVCLGWARRGRLILLQGGCPLIFAPTSANQHHQDINSVAPAVGLPPRK